MQPIPLSVLDLTLVDSGSNGPQALRNTIETAQVAERLGYHRIWLAEHHNTAAIASPAPEVMIGVLSRETSSIRLGSGGIMLPNHPPLKVAETFRVLEALAPGRIDLGIGRAPGTDTLTALALRRSQDALRADDFPEQLAELRGYNSEAFQREHPFGKIKAEPADVPLPPIWILGSSDFGARLAAALGLPFSFASHINMEMAIPALTYYKSAFVPSAELAQPRSMIAVSTICAESDEEVEYHRHSADLSALRLITGRFGPIPSPEEAMAYPWSEVERRHIQPMRDRLIAGTPDQVHERIMALVEATGADEVMVMSRMWGHENRLRSLELLAGAFGLAGISLAAG